MGRDGSDGSSELYDKGALTIAEDESTCVIYGMPKAAIESGAIRQILPLGKIAEYLRRITGV